MDLTLIRAAEAEPSPLGFRKFIAGRGEFEVRPEFIIGTESTVADWGRRYRDLWAWCLAQGMAPPEVLKPPGV